MKYDADFMMRKAREAAPREACGLVWEDGTTIEVRNTRKTTGLFVMDAEEFREAVFERGMFSAIWHTHPNGNAQPSERDVDIHKSTYPHVAMIIATPEVVVVYAVEE